MKTTRRVVGPLAVIFVTLFVIGFVIQAQTGGQASTDNSLQPVAIGVIPEGAAYFKLSDYLTNGGELGAPYPFLPDTNAPVYSLNGTAFLVDDANLTNDDDLANALLLLTQPQGQFSTRMMANDLPGGIPDPSDTNYWGGDSTNVPHWESQLSFSTNGLYLTISGITNADAYVNLMNTDSNSVYEILSEENLSTNPVSGWQSEGTLMGLDGITPTAVPTLGRSNLFLSARNITLDSSGQGIPDYWLSLYGLTGVDPWAYDSSGDGWTYFDEYQNGLVPKVWNTPPAPKGLVSQYDGANGVALVSWLPSPGPVINYTLERQDFATGETTDFTISGDDNYTDNVPDSPESPTSYGPTPYILYKLKAHYTGGDSPWTAQVTMTAKTLSPNNIGSKYSPSIRFIAGPQNSTYLAAYSLPKDAVALRFTRFDCPNDCTSNSIDISTSAFTNGLYQLPSTFTEPAPVTAGYNFWIQTIDASNHVGQPFPLNYGFWSFNGSLNYVWEVPPFFDGRQQMKQNLDFLLRAPNSSEQFGYDSPNVGSPGYSRTFYPKLYAYSGFYGADNSEICEDFTYLDAFLPFENNYIFRDFIFATDNMNANGELQTGVEDTVLDGDCDGNSFTAPIFNSSTADLFSEPTNLASIQSVLDPTNSQWTYFLPQTASGLSEINVGEDGVNYYMTNGTVNWFGLPYLSAKFAYNQGGSLQVSTLNAGGSIPITGGYVYAQTATPGLKTVDYYFARPFTDPMPGNGSFSISNTTPSLLVATLGQPFQLAGYAKQLLTNSAYTGVYGYLGQYFEDAYIITNGTNTTNRAGLLSPYGVFFPTNVGPAALVTMTNWGENAQGTAVVQVISMNVDANHDGVMDFSFCGSDQNSEAKPYRFWVNDNHDSGDDGGDGIPDLKDEKDAWNWYPGTNPDYRGLDTYMINGTRDLVDYFPVCLSIGGLLKVLPPSEHVVYMLKNADSALNLVYTDLHATNCETYLTDTNVARSVAYGTNRAIVVLDSGTVLDTNFLQRIATSGDGVVLIEGRTNTSSPLVLEVWRGNWNTATEQFDGTNLVASTSVYLDITGVEQMFRHKNLMPNQSTNDLFGPPDRLTDESVPNEPETNDKNFVFVHGYNVNPNQARGNAADVFKRMYWAGSHAKFYGVTWFGYDSQVLKQVTINLQTNIVHAFETAPHLADFIADLHGPTAVAAHSLGNVVVLSALSEYSAPITNYFMLNAAAAIEALDGDVELNTNMIHSDWLPYNSSLYASEWYNLFSNDFRQTLTWRGRFPNLGNTEVYNFYSSGEEVLREWTFDPPTNILSDAEQMVLDKVLGQSPVASFLWVWQEKSKGLAASDGLLSSTHGGWKFNTNYISLTPSQAALLPDSQLRTNAFFDFTSPSFPSDAALEGTLGNAYAYTYRNRILSDAIPALSWAVGSHPVAALDQPNDSHNFDMQNLYENGWPPSRGAPHYPTDTTALGEWHHSDYREIAFPYTHTLFEKFVELGNLK